MTLTPEQQITAQAFLLAVHEYAQKLRAGQCAFLPAHICIHLAPDSCWISLEHELHKELLADDTEDELLTLCERQPPACHKILTKI